MHFCFPGLPGLSGVLLEQHLGDLKGVGTQESGERGVVDTLRHLPILHTLMPSPHAGSCVRFWPSSLHYFV
jgi:hypothetical protein